MNKETDELVREFVAGGGRPQDWRPSYSVAPTNRVPIVREHLEDGDLIRELELASWNFVPSWAKPGGHVNINARLETIATNGLFRSAFISQHCLVPMSPGYYEWQQVGDGKQPYLIHGDGRTLAAAGLYAARKDGGSWKVGFTIITREARDASGEIHDRMPVFLEEETWSTWLDPTKVTDSDGTLAILEASSSAIAAHLVTTPVDRKVNNVRTADPTDPTLVDPITI